MRDTGDKKFWVDLQCLLEMAHLNGITPQKAVEVGVSPIPDVTGGGTLTQDKRQDLVDLAVEHLELYGMGPMPM